MINTNSTITVHATTYIKVAIFIFLYLIINFVQNVFMWQVKFFQTYYIYHGGLYYIYIHNYTCEFVSLVGVVVRSVYIQKVENHTTTNANIKY